jgi:predicted DCC family thiol-disulfide oxidoreductase YuxK
MIALSAATYGPWQFALFRVVFGAYLAVHFFSLVPYAGEVFGPSGMLPDPSLLPAHGAFPNPLFTLRSDAAPAFVLVGLGVLALAFAVGCARRVVAVALWFGWACLFHRNIFIANPSLPYVGWLLLACAVLPAGEPLSVWPRRRPGWRMDPWVFAGAWLLLAAGYTFSGLHKAAAESWQNGLAIKYVLELPMTRDGWLRELLLALPDGLFRLQTWSVLLLEIAFLPLCLSRRTRPWVFLAMLGMHAGILLTVSMTDLTLGMLVFHWFVVEPDWGIDRRLSSVVVFDGCSVLGDRVVGLLLQLDTERALRFAVRSERPTTKTTTTMTTTTTTDGDVFVYVRGGRALRRSTAAAWAVADLGGIGRLALLALLVPRPLRDAVYDAVVAVGSARWGRRATRRTPADDDRAWFVDDDGAATGIAGAP